MSYYSTNLLPDQTEIHHDPEFAEYGYKHKRSEVFEVEVIGFCENCNKRISTPDDVYVKDMNIYCSKKCEVEDNEQN